MIFYSLSLYIFDRSSQLIFFATHSLKTRDLKKIGRLKNYPRAKNLADFFYRSVAIGISDFSIEICKTIFSVTPIPPGNHNTQLTNHFFVNDHNHDSTLLEEQLRYKSMTLGHTDFKETSMICVCVFC